MGHLYISAQPGNDLFSSRGLRFLLQDRAYHLQRGADSGDHERNGGDFHKRAGNIAVGTCERHIVVVCHAAVNSRAVHDDGPDQGDRCADH